MAESVVNYDGNIEVSILLNHWLLQTDPWRLHTNIATTTFNDKATLNQVLELPKLSLS